MNKLQAGEAIVKPRVLRWEDPPHSRNLGNKGGRPTDSRWNDIAETLRDERGRWAVVFEGERQLAMSARSRISEGRTVCFRPLGDFEACVRSYEGTYTVYARYMGEDFS